MRETFERRIGHDSQGIGTEHIEIVQSAELVAHLFQLDHGRQITSLREQGDHLTEGPHRLSRRPGLSQQHADAIEELRSVQDACLEEFSEHCFRFYRYVVVGSSELRYIQSRALEIAFDRSTVRSRGDRNADLAGL